MTIKCDDYDYTTTTTKRDDRELKINVKPQMDYLNIWSSDYQSHRVIDKRISEDGDLFFI